MTGMAHEVAGATTMSSSADRSMMLPPTEHRRTTSSSALYVFNTPRSLLLPHDAKSADEQFLHPLAADKAAGIMGGASGSNSLARAVDAFDEEDEAGIMLLCGTIVHAADLSSQTLPFELATPWGRRIAQEFISQGEKEKAAGLKVTTPIWKDDKSFYAGQSFFCRTFVIPLWKAVCAVMPELNARVEILEANKKRYDEMVIELSSSASKPSSPRPPMEGVKVSPTAASSGANKST
jgi:hypothetical protein